MTGPMPVKIRYFAWVREKTGKAEEVLDLPAGIVTVGELMTWLKGQGPEYADAFARTEVIRAAVDQVHVKPTASFAGAREIAFFPPVTGG
jgi:sulfur-carrier protein